MDNLCVFETVYVSKAVKALKFNLSIMGHTAPLLLTSGIVFLFSSDCLAGFPGSKYCLTLFR